MRMNSYAYYLHQTLGAGSIVKLQGTDFRACRLQLNYNPNMNSDSYQTEILEVAQSAINYRKWLASLTFPYLGDNPLEFGSGIGDYAEVWLELGCPRITVSENSLSRIELLKQKFSNNPSIQVAHLDVEKIDFKMDGYTAVVSLNVIEHLENDLSAIRNIRNVLSPGGYFVAFTPAFPLLMSRFDRSVGHHRRYTKRTALALLNSAEFEVISVKYVNSVGWFAWFFAMRILQINPSEGSLLKIWDKLMIPIVRKIESRVTPPFGQSLLIVGRVPSS